MLRRQSALLWGYTKEEGDPLSCSGASRPAAAQANMGWVPLEAACETRGDITKLGHLGGVWDSPDASHSQNIGLDPVPLRTGLCDLPKGGEPREIGLCSVMTEASHMEDETDPQM